MQNWRNDAKYREVCAEILRVVYPQELLDIAPPPTPNRDEVINWFMHDAQLGLGTAKNKAATYLLIAAGDPSKQHDRSGKKKAPQKEGKRPAARRAPAKAVAYAEPALATAATSESQSGSANVRISPELQLNIQIHISPETSTDQIDAIFASMARYFRDQH